MKNPSVLLIGPQTQGGLGDHLSSLAQGLLNKGYQVILASPEPSWGLANLPHFPLLPGQHIANIKKLSSFIKKQKFSLVHTHGYKAGFIGRLGAILAGSPPLVHTVHNFFPSTGLGSTLLLTQMERLLAKKTAQIITVSFNLQNELLKKGLPAPKIITIYNGVNPERLKGIDREKARDLLLASAETLIIGTVARLIPAKGLTTFLKAIHELNRDYSNIKAIIIGDGPQAQELKELARKLGINDFIIFLGHRKDAPQLMAGFDIFVLPSLSEGLGIALLEAQWLGLPSIGSKTGGITEIITHEETGLLFTPGKSEELSQAVKNLLQNPGLKEKIAQEGQKQTRLIFSLEQMLTNTCRVYEKVLKSKELSSGTK